MMPSPLAKLHVKGTTQLSGSVNITPTVISGGQVSGNQETYNKKLTGTVAQEPNGSKTLDGTGTFLGLN